MVHEAGGNVHASDRINIDLAKLYGYLQAGKSANTIIMESKEFLAKDWNEDGHSINNMISVLREREEYVPTNMTSLWNAYDQIISDQIILTVPESATIGFTGLTEKSVLVTWSPHSDGGSPITGYHLVIKNEDTGQTLTELNTSYNTTSTLIDNLDSATNYKAYVIVINAIGNSVEQSYGFKTLGIKIEPEPTPEPTPEPEPITFCVNVYTLDIGGNILSNHYDKISIPNLQNLLNENKYIFYCKDGIIPTEQQVRDHYGYTAPVEDSTINSTMVSQSIGAFTLKDGRLKGEILYIANTAFNPFYYNKSLTSLVQIKSKSGIPIAIKPNNLNFTNTQRDERIQIDEAVGNFKELIVDFYVWKNTTDARIFADNKQIQVIDEPPDEPKPCQVGHHKDFNGKCVPDDPPAEIPRDKLIDTLKGFLFGTVALSLLAGKN